MRIKPSKSGALFSVAFRIPEWCRGRYSVFVNEKELSEITKDCIDVKEKCGYLYLTSEWAEETTIRLEFNSEIRAISSNSLVKENAGKVAFTKGPITYCMEEADNGEDLWDIYVLPDQLALAKSFMGEINGVKMTFLEVPALKIKQTASNSLYTDYSEGMIEKINVRLIPYFAWANRGEGEMRVWVPAMQGMN